MYTPESEMLDSRPTFTVTGGLSGAGMLLAVGAVVVWAPLAAVGAAAGAAAVVGAAAGAAAGAAGAGGAAGWQPSRARSRTTQILRPKYRMRSPSAGRLRRQPPRRPWVGGALTPNRLARVVLKV